MTGALDALGARLAALLGQNARTLPLSPWPQDRQPMGNGLPAIGALFGMNNLDPKIAPQVNAGSPRPLSPGEFVKNPNGSWSSEVSVTVPHPTNKGKWTNIPSVWVVNGMPRRLSQDDAMKAAASSGLKWPEYDTAEAADKIAAQREDQWQGVSDPRKVLPLWVK